MLLSEVGIIPPGQIVRDGHFRAVGFVDHLAEELLVSLHEGRFLDRLQNSNISCVITTDRLAGRVPERMGLVIHADPKTAFYDVHDYLFHAGFYGSSVPSVIAETARVHPRSYVAPMDVTIGPEAVIDPNVTVLGRAQIGAGAVIRAGCVIGAEGFGVRRTGGHQVHVPHAGSVSIGERVQILSNCTIVRAAFGGATTIGPETVINAQSYVAHHASIGARCLIAAGAIIAGSARVGDDAWIGAGAVISNGVHIGDKASVTLGAVVVRDVAAGERVSGHFAIPHRRFLSFLAKSGDR